LLILFSFLFGSDLPERFVFHQSPKQTDGKRCKRSRERLNEGRRSISIGMTEARWRERCAEQPE